MKNTRAQAKVASAAGNVSADALLKTMCNVLQENEQLRSENAQYQRLQAEYDQLNAEVQANKEQKRAEDGEAVVDLVKDHLWVEGDLSLLQDLFTVQPNTPGREKRWLKLLDYDPGLKPPQRALTGGTPTPPSPRKKKRTRRSRSCASAVSGAEDSAYSTDEDTTETPSTKTRRRKKQA